MGLFRRRQGARGVSVVPSAEGQRVDESNQRSTTLLERLLRRPERHLHEWEYTGRGLSGWGVVKCRTCPEWDIY